MRGGDGVYEIPDEFIINVFSRGVAKSTVIKQIAASMCHCVVLCSNVYYDLLDRGLIYADKDESTLGWFSLYRAGREIMEGYRVGPHESNILHKLISVAIHIAKTTGLRGEKEIMQYITDPTNKKQSNAALAELEQTYFILLECERVTGLPLLEIMYNVVTICELSDTVQSMLSLRGDELLKSELDVCTLLE